jgi:hypothetical protein
MSLRLGLVLVALASACASAPEHRRAHAGGQTLRVVNATATPVCDVHVASRDSKLWGPSWIDTPVPAGEHVDLAVRPDDYMLRVGDCTGGTKVVAYRVRLEGDLAIVIHDGYLREPALAPMPALALPSWHHDRSARQTLPGTDDSGVELKVRNHCAMDLRVVLGGDPKAQSGVPSTMPANATLRYYAPEGTTLWLVDSAYEVVAQTELSSATKHVEIAPTCDAFVRRGA